MEEIGRYIFGEMGPEEERAFEQRMLEDAELRAEVEEMEDTLLRMDVMTGKRPAAEVKDRIFAEIDAEAAQTSDAPKILTEASTAADYKPWLEVPGHQPPPDFESLFYIPVAQNEDGATIIVWIKDMVPEEVHHDAIEKFLVLEGSCEITFADKTYSLTAGDYLSIPLHHPHHVRVTSEITCKLIVQRIAA